MITQDKNSENDLNSKVSSYPLIYSTTQSANTRQNYRLSEDLISRSRMSRTNEHKSISSRVKFSDNSKIHISESPELKSLLALCLMIFVPTANLMINYIIDNHQLHFISFFSWTKFQELFTKIWSLEDLDLRFGFYLIGIYSLFQLCLMIIVPGPICYGPKTVKGHLPVYKNNGFRCYFITMLVFIIIGYYLEYYTDQSVAIIATKFSSILFCLTIFGFLFSFFLYIKGIFLQSSIDSGSSGNFLFDYYWGIELYPRVFGVDVKVFTNCRFGMTLWPLLILCFYRQSLAAFGWEFGIFVNVLLQILYITKFFWWESGYYNTLDIILDRAGFYICWGCIVFVPGFYTLSTHVMAKSSNNSNLYWPIALVLGLTSLIINYWADYQKQVFRQSNGKISLWGKPVNYIRAHYTDHRGHVHTNLLLISGFWGLARHFHYLPELLLAFSWCISSGPAHPVVLSYFVFLFILLIHRVGRDDKKCTAKYGDYYELYKRHVPYKIIPYIY